MFRIILTYNGVRNRYKDAKIAVTLYMSVWIEIRISFMLCACMMVTLYMSVWIEMLLDEFVLPWLKVTLYMNVWQDMSYGFRVEIRVSSCLG